MKKIMAAGACLVMLAGCSTVSPVEYANALSPQDAKWASPECQQKRADAATYHANERKIYWAAGAPLGPYGLGIVAAAKEHQAKQRKIFERDLHLACSNQPLPRELEPPKTL